LLSVIGLPHRHDVPILTARRPHHDDHAAMQVTHRDQPRFAILAAIVHLGIRRAGENLLGVAKINVSMDQRPFVLVRIERDRHFM
jgi:hypothetical protein